MQIQSTNMIPDDNLSAIPGFQYAPKICVDYLSHEWTQEDDIWTSWKVMSKKKKELSNGIRLENASWRTWAKQKYNLKTVSPTKLNWLKDSDVTWLYGPLHTSNIEETSPKLQNTLNLLPATTSTKSCLKKKSISEILRPKGRYGPLLSSNSDSQLYKKEKEKEQENDLDASDCETASTCSSISGPTTPTTGPTKLPVEKRKIQFNDRVEQCIAVESDQDVDELNHDSDSSSDDGILMKNSPPKKKKKDLSTICKLAPTKLKEDRIHNNEYSSLYSSSRRRANSSSSSSSNNVHNVHSVHNVPSTSNSTPTTTTSTSSTQDQSWMYDDDDDLDLDLIDFDTAISTTTYHHTDPIIPPLNNFNEEEEDKDDIVDKAVNIANGVREIMHWCSDMVLKGRIF